MNKIIKIALLVLITVKAFSQKQVKISFDLTQKTISIDTTVLHGDNIGTISINKNESIAFKILHPVNKEYNVQIKKGSDSLLSLNQEDFKNRNTIKTDSTLNLKGIALPDNFSVTITSASSILIKRRDFKIVRTSQAKKSETPETPQQPQGNQPTTAAPTPYKLGSMYYDAMMLKNYQSISNGLLDSILNYYSSDLDVVAMIQSNPFLKNVLKNLDTIKAKLANKKPENLTAQGSGVLSSAFSSIGGLDVTNIADGLAKFLVKRAKQELSIAFFQKFKTIIDKTPDIKTLFPQTAYLLDAIDQEIYDYQRYVQNLREAFKEDMGALPKNFPVIIDNHQKFFNQRRELTAALRSACYVADAIENQVHPGDILENYPLEYLDSLKSKNYKGIIQTAQLLSESLRDTVSSEDASYWVAINKIRDLINDKTAFQIYFGLLYERAKKDYNSIEFDNSVTLVNLMDKIDISNFKSIHNKYSQFILGFENKLDVLNKMIKNYSKPASDSVAVELYAKYLKTTIDMLEYSLGISKLPLIDSSTIGSKIGSFETTLSPYFDITNVVADMATYIVRKNYSGTINKAIYVYNEIVTVNEKKVYGETVMVKDTTAKKKIDKLTTNYLSKLSKKTGKTIPQSTINILKNNAYDSTSGAIGYEVVKDSDSSKNSKSTLNLLIKYGGFMATIATAKTSDDVEQVIESFALPVGSSRIKRETQWNIALNAYIGPYYGRERIKGVDSTGKWNSWGITAPVGVSVSHGHSILFLFHTNWAFSSSLFFSVVDIGALTSFRFTNDSASKVPSIQLKDIISPGIFYSLGIPKTPLSLNFGWQLGPLLRSVNLPANTYSNQYTRLSLSLCVDIPILNFLSVSK